MVCSRNPQCIVSLHSLVADQDILHRVVKSMSHVKLTCNIRWRHYDCKWFLTSVHFCVEILIFAPLLVQFVFNLFRIVSFLQILTHSLLLKYVFPGSCFHTFSHFRAKYRMCPSTFWRLRWSLAVPSLYAAVRILPEAFL